MSKELYEKVLEVARKALKDALPVISDKAAGGRMLTTSEEARKIFRTCQQALQEIESITKGKPDEN